MSESVSESATTTAPVESCDSDSRSDPDLLAREWLSDADSAASEAFLHEILDFFLQPLLNTGCLRLHGSVGARHGFGPRCVCDHGRSRRARAARLPRHRRQVAHQPFPDGPGARRGRRGGARGSRRSLGSGARVQHVSALGHGRCAACGGRKRSASCILARTAGTMVLILPRECSSCLPLFERSTGR